MWEGDNRGDGSSDVDGATGPGATQVWAGGDLDGATGPGQPLRCGRGVTWMEPRGRGSHSGVWAGGELAASARAEGGVG